MPDKNKKLKIAVKALEEINHLSYPEDDLYTAGFIANKALEKLAKLEAK